MHAPACDYRAAHLFDYASLPISLLASLQPFTAQYFTYNSFAAYILCGNPPIYKKTRILQGGGVGVQPPDLSHCERADPIPASNRCRSTNPQPARVYTISRMTTPANRGLSF
jgi:hypothetical protein